MNRRYKNSRRFFTLLEVLVSMGVFTILMLALMQFFSAAQTVWEKSGNRTETYESARMVCQMLRENLRSAFYGDSGFNMGDHLFFSYKEENQEIHLTFGAEKDEELKGLDYHYFPVTSDSDKACTLFLKELKISDSDYSSHWITKGSSWVAFLQGKAIEEKHELLKNVIYFTISTRVWEEKVDPTDPTKKILEIASSFKKHATPSSDIQKRPPPQVYITIGVVSEDALEKIARSYGKMGALNNDDNRKAALETIMVKQGSATKSLFDDVFDTSTIVIKANSNALDGEGANQQRRRWLLEGTQFFNILVHIDR